MATTDANGMVFYDTLDPVDDLQVLLNGISTATTNAFNGVTRTFRVANQAARDALLTSRGASVSSPLQVDRADTGNIERNTTGVIGGWTVVGSNSAWTPWTATLSGGFAVGTTGGNVAETVWRREGDLVHARYRFVFGTNGTASFGSGATFTLPVPASPTSAFTTIGTGIVTRGVTSHLSVVRIEATTYARITLGVAPLADITITSPWGGAWTSLDTLSGSVLYRT